MKEFYPKCAPNKKTDFFWKQTWRNEICMVEVSIGSYKEETNIKDGKVYSKRDLIAHLLWKTLILSMKNVLIGKCWNIRWNFFNNCWKLKIIEYRDVMHIFLNNSNQYWCFQSADCNCFIILISKQRAKRALMLVLFENIFNCFYYSIFG